MLGTMSKDSELVLAAYEAWNRGDLDGWLKALHPEVELTTSGVFPDFEPVYRGHKGLTEFWHQLREPWEVFHIEVEEIDDDEFVAVTLRFRAKGVDSGVKVDMRFGNAIRISDGLAIEIVTRRTVEEARLALRGTRSRAPGQRS
jgi:ketosteroid isomerase-like protein